MFIGSDAQYTEAFSHGGGGTRNRHDEVNVFKGFGVGRIIDWEFVFSLRR